MNERIKELLAKCTDSQMTKPWPLVDTKKFAELIIEEMYCFMVDATSNDEPWPSFNQILEHFGVE